MALKYAFLILPFTISACAPGGGYSYYPTAPSGDLGTHTDGSPGDLRGNDSEDLAGPLPADLSTPPLDLSVLPDLSTLCVAGHYVGPVTATVSALGIAEMVSGTVDLTVASPQGSILAVSGTMMATNGGAGSATADVTGQIDCSILQMTGTLSNGMATEVVNGQAFKLPFTGTISASYDAFTLSLINGTLTTMGLTGSGTWSASHQ